MRALGEVTSVTVFDNASVDDTPALARTLAWGAPTDVVASARNLGFGAACNAAVRSVADPAPYVLLLNPDASVPEGGLARLVADLDADPALGCVGARLTRPSGEPVSSARYFPTWRSVAARRAQDVEHRGALVEADWVCGALMLWRREAFDGVGGFADAYFLYYEDTDICRRAADLGWRTAVDGRVHATHDQGHGLRTPAHLRRHSRRSRRRYALRWLGWRGALAVAVADAAELAGASLRAIGLRR
ncbi:hypothetical protein Q760_15375 [Cellulomonas cellasea DSM 20118]|uniref:Glycosyltransferase 2-like domain-containing protein n=1 Tax=Cellulomonas cellasea DSM 20118 TaxID=1408250 RepID=A0A0A0BA02_9CELL|nr:hypothetical protein Q760_15375 [Cellulomonas cellasea DSM 20118]